MSFFKSPLLLLGLLVILLAGTALIAPIFIDWGSYRGEFEKYGRQLTGRETKVAGDISVTLFPWPKMTIKDVSVANPPEAGLKHLFRADEVLVKLALAPLLSGKLVVEGVEVNRPTIGLERLATGKGTWLIKPHKGALDIFGAEDVAIDNISITNGTIVLADGSRGGEAQLDGFNAIVSARSLVGPWKLRGEAVINDEGVLLNINTGKWRKGQSFKFGVRLSPVDVSGFSYAFDGEIGPKAADDIKGKLDITPARRKSAGEQSNSDFRPLVFRSEIAANFDRIKFSKIEVAPKNAVDVRSFITGDGVVELGSIIRVGANLKASFLDVDTLLGNKGRKRLRSFDALAWVSSYVDQLPPNIQLKSSLEFSSLVIAGEKFEGTQVSLEVFDKTLSIKKLLLTLPGQTKTIFKGSLIGGVESPQLIGELGLNGVGLKNFAQWVFEDHKDVIDAQWSGLRGRFQLSSKIDLSKQNFRLRDGKYTLDGVDGDIGFSIKQGENPAATFDIKTAKLNLDQYAPQGVLPLDKNQNLSDRFVGLFTQLVGDRDIRLSSNIGELTVNKVNARNVKLDFDADEKGIYFREVGLTVVGGADVHFSGGIKFLDNSVSGSINGALKARRPEKLLQLLGVSKLSDLRLAALSPIDIKVVGEAKAGNKTTDANLHLEGEVGGSKVSANGKFNGDIKAWQKAKLHLSGQVSSKSAKSLLALLDVKIDKGIDTAGRFAITATGTPDQGLASTADFESFGVQSQFSGLLKFENGQPHAAGRLAVLAQDTSTVFEVLGLPLIQTASSDAQNKQVFSGEGIVAAQFDKIVVNKVRGTTAGTSFKGDLKLVLADDKKVTAGTVSKPSLNLKLQTGKLSAPYLIDLLVLNKDNKKHSLKTRISNELLKQVDIDIDVSSQQLNLWGGFGFKQGKFVFRNVDRQVTLALSGDDTSGNETSGNETKNKTFSAKLSFDIGNQITQFSGQVMATSALSELLLTRRGDQVLVGQFDFETTLKSSGRTFGGILAGLEGEGVLSMKQGRLMKVSPANFSAKLTSAETAEDVENLVLKELSSGDLTFGDVQGKFKIENGVMSSAPVKISGGGASGRLRAIYEVSSNRIDISALLKLDQPSNVPAFEIAYAGAPKFLVPSSDFSALKSQLSVAAINKTLDKLKALEEEQRRLIEEEKKEREAAQAKYKKKQEKQQLIRKKQQELIRQSELKEAEKEKALQAAKKKARVQEERAKKQATEELREQAKRAKEKRAKLVRERRAKRAKEIEDAKRLRLQSATQQPRKLTPLPQAIIVDVPPIPQEGSEPLFIPLPPQGATAPPAVVLPQPSVQRKQRPKDWRKNRLLDTR